MILLIRNLKNSQPYRNREWKGGSQDLGDGEMKELLSEGPQTAATQELETRRATPCQQQTALHGALKEVFRSSALTTIKHSNNL